MKLPEIEKGISLLRKYYGDSVDEVEFEIVKVRDGRIVFVTPEEILRNIQTGEPVVSDFGAIK
jgi:hypothetical protein